MRSPNAAHRRATLILVTTAALMFGTSAVHAAYYVQTYADATGGYNRGCAATYNYGNTFGQGAAFISDAGNSAPCAHPVAQFNGQTLTTIGTEDTTGKLTAANDSSNLVTDNGSYSANATASADLKTGKVHLTGTGAGIYAGFGSFTSLARLNDTLHFTVAGANASTVTLVPVSFSFAGNLIDGATPSQSSAELNWSFSFGNASTYEFGDYGAGYYAPPRYPTYEFPETTPSRTSGWESYSFASYTPTDTRFTGLYAITGASADIPIDFLLEIRGNGLTLDYSNGGTIGVGDVSGLSYTSDSGVFGTGGRHYPACRYPRARRARAVGPWCRRARRLAPSPLISPNRTRTAPPPASPNSTQQEGTTPCVRSSRWRFSRSPPPPPPSP